MNSLSRCVAKSICIFFSAAFLLSMPLPPVQAQKAQRAQKAETPPAKASEAAAPGLLDQLTALSAKFKVAFVLEGTSEDFPAKKAADATRSKEDAANDELTSRIADLCADYGLSPRRERNVILLLRRYTNTDALPGLTLPEVGKVARDLTKIMAPFESQLGSPDPSRNRLFVSFYSSLTSDQIERMKGDASSGKIPQFVPGNNLVPVTELSSEQQGTVQSVIQAIYLRDASRDARQSQKEIASIVGDGADFCWHVLHGVRSFGCEIALRDEKGDKVFIPLSDPDRLRRLSDGVSISKEAMDSGTDTSPFDTVTNSVLVSSLPVKAGEEDTLQTAAAQAAQKENKTVLLEDELLQKPALIIGAENAASDTELRGLCAAYGLRLRTLPEGDKRSISRYPAVNAANLAGLHAAVLAAIPPPFLRALMADAKPKAGQPSNASADLDTVNAALVPFGSGDPQAAPEKRFRRRLTVIRSAAARKLRSTLEAKVASSKGGKVSLNTLSPTERMAFANVLMVDYLTCLGEALTSPVPDIIAHYDRTTILCRRITSHGLPCVVIAFFSPASDGQPYQGGMTMVVVDRSTPPASR